MGMPHGSRLRAEFKWAHLNFHFEILIREKLARGFRNLLSSAHKFRVFLSRSNQIHPLHLEAKRVQACEGAPVLDRPSILSSLSMTTI